MFKFIDKIDSQKRHLYTFLLIMVSSALIRIFFIYYTSVYDMQHDAGTPYENYGHLGYISYLMNHLHLPDFDVREAFQFWHPPLHHTISAIFLSLVWKIFPGQVGNYEALQLLPFLYMTVCIWVIWKTLQLWNIQGKTLCFLTLLIAFHPTFITLSGSINSDALCTMFTFLAIYFALLWYRTPGYRLMIASALFIGLGMSSKGSAAIAAFPIAFLFLVKLIKEKGKVIPQLLVFAIISLPLGLWWYVRNYIAFGVPLDYIYYMSTDTVGYLADIPLWRRIFDFDPRFFSYTNTYLQFEGRFTDVNPIIGLLKTAVFGQWRFNYSPYIKPFAYILLFVWIALTMIALLGVPSFLLKNKEKRIENISVIILFVVQFASYYSFCLNYPFVWTMDFRYAIPLLLCQLLLIGEAVKSRTRLAKGTGYLCTAFTGLTVICFLLLGFTSF